MSRLGMYARFISGMPSLVRTSVTIEDARKITLARMASREKNFIDLLDKTVFSQPKSPYTFLFREAGCQPEDVRRLVRNEGVDDALSVLYDEGVRLSFEEMKGRANIVRGGRTFEGSAESFDNPHALGDFESQTSGSSGKATRIRNGFANLVSQTPDMLIAQDANGTLGAPTVLYRPGMPDTTGLNNVLRHIVVRNPVRRWFSPVTPANGNYPLRFRAAAMITPSLVRASGAPFPRIEVVPFTDALIVARATAELAASEGRCNVRCSVSTALCVSLAAIEKGIDLRGVTFTSGGEPASPAKIDGILRSGARYVTGYAMMEVGQMGLACPRGVDATDVHVIRSKVSILQRMTSPADSEPVGMLFLTTLLSSAPKILINVATDDFGILEERSCGCPLDQLGMHQHIRQMKSFSKLTGRGITLVASDIAHIIEDILPERFGGTPQDYQLIEEEDGSGVTHLYLLVSPDVFLPDERAPAQTLLEELARGTPGATLQGDMLRNANAVRVRRQKPKANARGKLPPFKTVATT
jgi:hypothetical protein